MNKLSIVFVSVFCLLSFWSGAQPEKARLIILADMGNEPDEEQQIMHMLMYSNEFEVEGLIAVTGKYLRPDHREVYRRVLHPELFHGIINGYENVLDNLKKHAEGWPEAYYLRSIVVTGQPGYGIRETGAGKSSPGSELLIRSLTKPDSRPVYVVVNAGSNTLAQALIDYQADHSKEEMDAVIKKLRVFENGAQDNAGAWICSRFPEIHWTRSNFQTYSYGGPAFDSSKGEKNNLANMGPYTWEPYAFNPVGQHQWAMENIIANHGHLGKCYPLRQSPNGVIHYLEGGGTIPWMGLIHQGLSDIDHPDWGGWSGRFSSGKIKNVYSRHADVRADEEKYSDFALYTEAPDQWTDTETDSVYKSVYSPVWRWRRAYFNDFKCRMDWCVQDYENANHPPVAVVNGDSEEKIHIVKAMPGDVIKLDASASTDPDGDQLKYKWWFYPEAGTYEKTIQTKNTDQPKFTFSVPGDAGGKTIHVILEISDLNTIASLTDYRRVVFNVESEK